MNLLMGVCVESNVIHSRDLREGRVVEAEKHLFHVREVGAVGGFSGAGFVMTFRGGELTLRAWDISSELKVRCADFGLFLWQRLSSFLGK